MLVSGNIRGIYSSHESTTSLFSFPSGLLSNASEASRGRGGPCLTNVDNTSVDSYTNTWHDLRSQYEPPKMQQYSMNHLNCNNTVQRGPPKFQQYSVKQQICIDTVWATKSATVLYEPVWTIQHGPPKLHHYSMNHKKCYLQSGDNIFTICWLLFTFL